MRRSVLTGLVAVATVACTADAHPPPIASRSTVTSATASTALTEPPTARAGSTGPPSVAPELSAAPTSDRTADRPSDSTDEPIGDPSTDSTPDDAAVLPEGFDRVEARVTEPDGTVCELCMWVADDADRRSRGLMFVTDLGPADGMAFVYPEARTSSFWMKNTLLPLSIAFFGTDGVFLSSFDMEPCASDPCPRYRTAPDFLVAVETVQGALPTIGIVPGSTFELLDRPC